VGRIASSTGVKTLALDVQNADYVIDRSASTARPRMVLLEAAAFARPIAVRDLDRRDGTQRWSGCVAHAKLLCRRL
jgi:hypothetical protein